MRTKDFHIRSGSLFGARVAEMEGIKKAVARETVTRVLWPHGMDPKNPVFFSDGSSSSYVWCYYLGAWLQHTDHGERLSVWTNNVDVPLQGLCEPNAPGRVAINVAPGEFSFKYCANFGASTEAWCAEHCKRSVCVLSVTGLDGELGPCGRDTDARGIKRAVLENANFLVIVADCTKLRKRRDPAHAAAPEVWHVWRDKWARQGRLVVVTSLSTAADRLKREPFRGFPDERSPDGIESDNLWWLRERLGDQLIIVNGTSS
jgi:hypothetical protein